MAKSGQKGKSEQKGKAGKKGKLGKRPPRPLRADERPAIIEYDDSKRRDYLTGFHKRNLERKKKAIEYHMEQARQERLAARREARGRIAGVLPEIERIEAIRKAASGELDESLTTKRTKTLKDRDLITTVTITEFNPDTDGLESIIHARDDDGNDDDSDGGDNDAEDGNDSQSDGFYDRDDQDDIEGGAEAEDADAAETTNAGSGASKAFANKKHKISLRKVHAMGKAKTKTKANPFRVNTSKSGGKVAKGKDAGGKSGQRKRK
ncbi:uncharacterized protein BJ171DRAFT_594764 [Polychytrium aggregatum]|uniref:uncharacterized protein n=1 Tax=Polychytrium aggregatum TaxID=110093 RepID=UPI0022FEB10E|nr:uncharacterized protein BJ171DRAFT_594764 [Polychytrium aggregatum]KAI9209745.1 hypothetical protein BJ171DRAFT_594764 [Polychytrium aggregatum]